MKIKTKITALLACLTFLASCKESEEYGYHHTVGEENNAITLMAGISEGGAKLQTRAVDGNHAADDTYGGGHKAFSTTNNTQLRLRVDGTWLSKGFTNNLVSKQTTATTGSVTGKHNELSFSPQLYWDDYGTADPANIDSPKGTASTNTGGRGKGLTIYGVAVNEKTLPTQEVAGRSKLSEVSDWTNIAWNVGDGSSGTIDQSTTNGWGDYDLLISNNVKTGKDGTLKFDDLFPTKQSTASDLLEFTHAMSKITFVLTAGDGFPVENTIHKFVNTPEVTLTSRVTGDNSTEEWGQTKGSVNVETGSVTLASTPVKASIKMHHAGTDATTKKVTLDALVFPGSEFKDASGEPAKYPVIARIKADDNIYYITTKQIRAAIQTAISASKHGSSYVTEPGKNYIFNVTINKTEIKVTATVTNWVNVKAETVTPTINITADWGTTTGASTVDGFSFYRSLSLNNGYSNGLSTNANDYFAAEAIAKKPSTDGAQWVFNDGTKDIKLFWPTHDTHYQFRGVWPKTSTETSNTETEPHVKALSASDDTQIINISNVAYSANSYPSDLMIARPEFGLQSDGTEIDPECTNSDHTHKKLYSEGICATEGKVKMNFRYVMSQVEVELQTVTGDAAVNIGPNTKVEIVNVANTGYVKLGDRVVVPNTQNQTYVLNPANTGSLTGDALTKAQRTRHSAIVPQTLTYTNPGESTNVRFKVTIYKGDSTTDVDDIYYADINPILESGKSTKVAPNGKWESGVHYKYILTLKKTEIKVTATITPWTEVTANQPVWF